MLFNFMPSPLRLYISLNFNKKCSKNIEHCFSILVSYLLMIFYCSWVFSGQSIFGLIWKKFLSMYNPTNCDKMIIFVFILDRSSLCGFLWTFYSLSVSLPIQIHQIDGKMGSYCLFNVWPSILLQVYWCIFAIFRTV